MGFFLPGQKSRITHVTHYHIFCAPQSDMCLKAMLVSHMQNEHLSKYMIMLYYLHVCASLLEVICHINQRSHKSLFVVNSAEHGIFSANII